MREANADISGDAPRQPPWNPTSPHGTPPAPMEPRQPPWDPTSPHGTPPTRWDPTSPHVGDVSQAWSSPSTSPPTAPRPCARSAASTPPRRRCPSSFVPTARSIGASSRPRERRSQRWDRRQHHVGGAPLTAPRRWNLWQALETGPQESALLLGGAVLTSIGLPREEVVSLIDDTREPSLLTCLLTYWAPTPAAHTPAAHTRAACQYQRRALSALRCLLGLHAD